MLDIKVPSPGESITEVEISSWLVSDGDFVEQDQEIAEIESDKATLPLIAEESGVIHIKVEEGTPVAVGSVACSIDTEAKADKKTTTEDKKEPETTPEKEEKEAATEQAPTEAPKESTPSSSEEKAAPEKSDKTKVTPVAKKMMQEKNLDVDAIIKGLKRISKDEVEAVANLPEEQAAPQSSSKQPSGTSPSREQERKKLSQLRKKLSQRLVSVKNETAMLTTFNEVDMTEVMRLRKTYQKKFIETHDIKLGFMSFFTKAVTLALKAYPAVNSQLDGEELVTPEYADIAIAVQTPKGLMVPVLRNAETKSLATIEQELKELADKARKGRISIDEMTGGTFTITNGGVFGSLLSTPILNPPQSGILGMHNIQERPVAIDGQVVIRPMMYIALSYDHRVIDGRDSVGFLVKIKELLENPHQMLLGPQSPDEQLLEL
jgi:2-oxoglutarate dehydrogenase E2 component (dihydrolipoamide succinyltransferase)